MSDDYSSKTDGASDESALVKARVITNKDTQQSNLRDLYLNSKEESFWSMSSATSKEVATIKPPYCPRSLQDLCEHSSALQPCIDSYVSNIDAFGHKYKCVLNLESNAVEDEVANSLFFDKLAKEELGAVDVKNLPDIKISVKETNDRIKFLKTQHLREKSILTAFFSQVFADGTFAELRKRTRRDLEQTGNAYWEVLRRADGKIVGFNLAPVWTMRLCVLDTELTEYTELVRTPSYALEEEPRSKRFRKFAQKNGTTKIYFKELGDPRVVSSATGLHYGSYEDLQKAERKRGKKEIAQATEIFHVKIDSSWTPYGVPRWMPNYINVMGARKAEEVNYLYFDNKAIPPLAIMVSGGKIAANTVKKLESFVEENLKGTNNFHKILILEAEATSVGTPVQANPVTPRITIQPLNAAQQDDGLFLNYLDKVKDSVGSSFRLPRILRSDMRDFNKASAVSALELTEKQVFAPARQEFDAMINSKILPHLGVCYTAINSNGPITQDPLELAQILEKVGKLKVLSAQETRSLLEDVFNVQFDKVTEPWASRPMSLTELGINAQRVNIDGSDLGEVTPVEPKVKATDPLTKNLAPSVRDADEAEIVKVSAEQMADFFA